MLGQRVAWKKQIRPDALAVAKNRCSVCGSADGRLICHDKWRYDDKKAIATLVGFEIHCSLCDATTHVGRAAQLGPVEEVLLEILNHLCNVNRCKPKEAEAILESAMALWQKRSQKEWTIKIAAPFVKQYPELAALPEFVPPPIR